MISETRRLQAGYTCPDCKTGLVYVSHFEEHPTLKTETAVLKCSDCQSSEYDPDLSKWLEKDDIAQLNITNAAIQPFEVRIKTLLDDLNTLQTSSDLYDYDRLYDLEQLRRQIEDYLSDRNLL